MPTYEYLCTECEHAFEVLQSFTDAAIEICPICQGQVRKVYKNVGVVFKGSGFYKTDSRSTPASPATAATPTTPATTNTPATAAEAAKPKVENKPAVSNDKKPVVKNKE